MRSLFDWLDHRTGYRALVKGALFEHIPGGSRWRYVWGSTLTFAIAVQFITGIFLWMFYSPSAQTAWESVYYIQYEVPGGWLLRGIHHYTAQVMTVLLLLHLMQVVVDGAYRAPREVNFWFGMGLLMLTLALSLTGYLLPWDQKGYWATKVATNIAGGVPLIGDALKRIVVGGADYGHHTLTRFFALHAGILPLALIGLIIGHIYLFRRHGITPKEPRRKPDAHFWPDQVLKDAVACLAVLLTVMVFVLWHRGAGLTAPANPAEQFSAARPDWYFMFLYQFLKYFEGDKLIWGSVIIPSLFVLAFMLLPFLGALRKEVPVPFWGRQRLGDAVAVGFLWICLGGFVFLTVTAFVHDWQDPHGRHKPALAQAERDVERVKDLIKANRGVPPQGALALIANDPLTQGPRIFQSKCASCHSYGGEDGMGIRLAEVSAADLKGFGSREWLAGFLDPERIVSDHYWGGTKFVNPPEGERQSKMVSYVLNEIAEFGEPEHEYLKNAVIGLSAQAELASQRVVDERDSAIIEQLPEVIGMDGLVCLECHHFQGEGKGLDLTGWGSREWMIDIVVNPAHPRFYGDNNDRMPAYGGEVDEAGNVIKPPELSPEEIGLVVDWLRGEWLRVEGSTD